MDYYKVIKNPVSLKSVQKAVRGIKGRDKPTNLTFLKSWSAFEEEISHVWGNARTYNEDGSDIYNLAGELEVRVLYHIPHNTITDNIVRNISNADWQKRSVLFKNPRSPG